MMHAHRVHIEKLVVVVLVGLSYLQNALIELRFCLDLLINFHQAALSLVEMVVNGDKSLFLFSWIFLAYLTRGKGLGKSAKNFTPDIRNNHLFRTVA